MTTDQPWSEISPFAAADRFFGSYFLFSTIDILHLHFFRLTKTTIVVQEQKRGILKIGSVILHSLNRAS
jgi:hypothetical protein